MEFADVLRILIRWTHAVAAVTWIGGSLFYLFAIEPALAEVGRTPPRIAFLEAIGRQFREVVNLTIILFLATGAILSFDRLSQPRIPGEYVAVLALKIALSLIMFWIVTRLGRRRGSTGPATAVAEASGSRFGWIRRQHVIVLLGLIVYLLAIVLNAIVEAGLQK